MLAQAGDVTLFEATFVHGGLLCRADVVRRMGKVVDLFEIKSSSIDSREGTEGVFRAGRDAIRLEWRRDLEDLAFQTLVLRRALGCEVRPHIVCVDLAGKCDGLTLHSTLRWSELPEGSGRRRARHPGPESSVRDSRMLVSVPAQREVDELLGGDEGVEAVVGRLFGDIRSGALYSLPPPVSGACKDCEFRNAPHATPTTDGFAECWGPEISSGYLCDMYRASSLGRRDGASNLEDLYGRGVRKLVDIPLDAIQSSRGAGQRQSKQLAQALSGQPWLQPALREQLDALAWPLHFLDFEAARAPVPYYAGMQPYQLLVFQFSCHIVACDAPDGLSHRGWLQTGGDWPLVEFLTQLRDALGSEGSVLCWSPYERVALESALYELEERGDKPELVSWLRTVVGEDGEGRIVDLQRLCLEHYIHPAMRGSTSIKSVLPAIWRDDAAMRAHPWFAAHVQTRDGELLSPYDTLPQPTLTGVEPVRDGLGAVHAYQHVLHTEEREEPSRTSERRSLLESYCRLDTLAMVMVWWHWRARLASP
ncbi:MAG: DUF2779 domain-containing protein [Planctomycetes bacterium]|nr:DUF2779 domain-containing protein [Planctomycetota bacterium]